MLREIIKKTKYDAELNSLSGLRRDLERLEKKSRGPDAKTIAAALEALREHIKTTEDLRTLARKLIEIENEHESESKKFPDQMGKVDLGASVMALEAIFDFLPYRAYSRNLSHLRTALIEIVLGAVPAAMFQPEEHGKGRRADSPWVLQAKGMLAGLMEVKQSNEDESEGMSRQEAARWIAQNVSPELAKKISNKPITARMVEEWRDRYGGPSGEEGVARESYLHWRNHYSPSAQKFREITEYHSKRLLARKPS